MIKKIAKKYSLIIYRYKQNNKKKEIIKKMNNLINLINILYLSFINSISQSILFISFIIKI